LSTRRGSHGGALAWIPLDTFCRLVKHKCVIDFRQIYYLPQVTEILEVINAMALSKFNVLHWHLADAQSWPLQLAALPNLASAGSHSTGKRYTALNVTYIVVSTITYCVRH
jgi:hypothetical protein